MAENTPASVTPQRRHIRVGFDFADAVVRYEWTDADLRPNGDHDFGIFATFGEAKAVALAHLRAERDRWVAAIRDHRAATIAEVIDP